MSTELAPAPAVRLEGMASLAATPANRQQLICTDMVQGESLDAAHRDARNAYAAMLNNPLVIATYGEDALSGLNTLIKRLFGEINAGKDPEVARIVKGLTKSLDDISHKYDASDPKFVAKYGKTKGSFLGIFGGINAFWRTFLRDVTSIDAQIKHAEEALGTSLIEVERMTSYYHELYKENEAELKKVIYQIAVMELVVALATEDVETMPQGEDHDTSEARATRADLIKNLGNRISGYKSRLFMGWTTSPQIRSQISLNTGLYNTVSLTRQVTFPAMMQQMILIAQLHRAKDIASQTDSFRNAMNIAVQQYAVNAAVLVPEIEQSVSMPIMLAETIKVMRDEFVKQTEGVIRVLSESAEQNAVLDDLYQNTAQVFRSQSDKVSDAIIDRALAATRKLEVSTASLAS